MSDGPLLLKGILDNPDDDAARLVYADWLQEDGQFAWADFIRVQIEYARIPSSSQGNSRKQRRDRAKLKPRIQALWDLGTNAGGFLELPAGWGIPSWRRGFVEGTHIAAGDWLAIAAAMTAAHPIRWVTFATEPRDTGKLNHFALWKKMEKGEPWRSYRWTEIEFEMPHTALLTP
jgi:uncharacterized protein (TIGR02996 family)